MRSKIFKLAGVAFGISMLPFAAQAASSLQPIPINSRAAVENSITSHTYTGKITTVSAPDILFHTKDGVSYTADASQAKIIRKNSGKKMLVTDLRVGDNIVVRGSLVN